MGKHTVPPVTARDVYVAMPRLSAPLAWTWVVRDDRSGPRRVYCAIELGIGDSHGFGWTFKRWGRTASLDNPNAVWSALLIAAQECYQFVEGVDKEELLRLALWERSARDLGSRDR